MGRRSLRKQKVAVAVDPRLVTLADTLTAAGGDRPVSAMGTTATREALEAWASGNWAIPEGEQFEVLAAVFRPLSAIERAIDDLGVDLTERRLLGGRADAAASSVMVAIQYLKSALLTGLRRSKFAPFPTLTLIRTSLEGVGRAAHIARGAGNPASRYRRGDEFKVGDYWPDLVAMVAFPEDDHPAFVYKWLSHYAHANVKAFERPPDYEDVLAAWTYTARACTRVAEAISGLQLLTGVSDFRRHQPWSEPSPALPLAPAPPSDANERKHQEPAPGNVTKND